MTTVFEQMATHMINHNDTPLKIRTDYIDPEDYTQWKEDFIWEALHGQRYGQSFCNRFGITDNHLYYNTGGIDWADNYIKKTYLARP
jgi:hypothetical protein